MLWSRLYALESKAAFLKAEIPQWEHYPIQEELKRGLIKTESEMDLVIVKIRQITRLDTDD